MTHITVEGRVNHELGVWRHRTADTEEGTLILHRMARARAPLGQPQQPQHLPKSLFPRSTSAISTWRGSSWPRVVQSLL